MSDLGPILILSIDGGGTRGVIPAQLLYHLEKEAGINVYDSFDFFAGVSTGATIATYCAQNAGSMEQLANFSYSSENLSHMFNQSIWDRLLGRMQNQPKYDGINKRQYIEDVCQGLHINDIKDKHLLILAYDFINRELVTFKNNRGHDASYNPSLAEICDASTAAPTLYPTVDSSAPMRRWLIDGSIATNDPSVCAITEALAIGHTFEDLWIISLGTGKPVHDLGQQDRDRIGKASRKWGVAGWLNNGLLDYMMSASSSVSFHQCEQLLGERYLRVDGFLPRKLMQLDNTNPKRVEDLRSYAFLWFEEKLTSLRQLLTNVAAVRAEASNSSSVNSLDP
ncbi:MAG: patatin-like phospholipase family protein [Porticoccaceae bacterium]